MFSKAWGLCLSFFSSKVSDIDQALPKQLFGRRTWNQTRLRSGVHFIILYSYDWRGFNLFLTSEFFFTSPRFLSWSSCDKKVAFFDLFSKQFSMFEIVVTFRIWTFWLLLVTVTYRNFCLWMIMLRLSVLDSVGTGHSSTYRFKWGRLVIKIVNYYIFWHERLRRKQFFFFICKEPLIGELSFARNCSELEGEGLSDLEIYCIRKNLLLLWPGT